MLVTVLVWIIFGGLAGWIATLIMQEDELGNHLLSNVAIGVLGAIAGGLIMRFFLGEISAGFSATGLIIAITGSVLLLAIARGFSRV